VIRCWSFWALSSLLLVSCASGGEGLDLSVDVRTDLVPGVEFTGVLVTREGDTRMAVASLADDYVSGQRVAEFDGLAASDFNVDVALVSPSGTVIEREVAVQLRGDLAITVVMTRDCDGVECPGAAGPSATACLGGQCVDPSCTPETPELCPTDECIGAEDCPAPSQPCFEAACVFGVCFEADTGSCGVGRFCDETFGCTEVPGDGAMPMRDAGPDGGPRDAGPPADGGPGPDSGPELCGDEVCVGFTECIDDECVAFSPCFSDSECLDGTICRDLHCVPPDSDPDGDGTPAVDDCSESDPLIYPGANERCNSTDDDCDETIDEGNPGVLCAEIGETGECMAGSCGCNPGTFDLDGIAETGCECNASPDISQYTTCAEALDLGTLVDIGQMTLAMANALPTGREVWYRFRANDQADTMCDNFHVRAQLVMNPDDAYRFEVFRGTCGDVVCDGEGRGFTDFSWATDFGPGSSGECPCRVLPPAPAADMNRCNDNSADFFIRVFRRADAPESCSPFTLEISNGVYDS